MGDGIGQKSAHDIRALLGRFIEFKDVGKGERGSINRKVSRQNNKVKFSRYLNDSTHQQGSRDVPLAHLVERHAKLHPEKQY